MEVLRLAAQGLSYRQIGQRIGISASTIQGYVKRAQSAGLSWPLPNDVDALALEARLFKRGEEEYRPGRPAPDWLEGHHERTRGKHVTLQLLWLEYKRDHPDAPDQRMCRACGRTFPVQGRKTYCDDACRPRGF